jgi:quinol-cytochrome oxidoreductase complex cytochrome b subunit
MPRTDQKRRRYLLKNLALHFRPSTVPDQTLRFTLSFGLGGMAAVLVLMQFATGILLKFVYEPTPVAAYASIQFLQTEVPFGPLIRNLHHWCANLLVVIIFLHLLRVFFSGAFHAPRQFNWVVGLVLFGLVLFANFTGYLLPYDQLAFWAVTVFTGMLAYVPGMGHWLQTALLGARDLGPASLRIFFAFHTAVIPILMTALLAFHFWRVRKAGGLVIPRRMEDDNEPEMRRVTAVPNLLLRELTVALVLVAVVLLWSVFIDAPLGEPANPGLSPNPTKAPWYFAGLQELLLHFHPLFGVFIIPLLAVMALISIPYVNYDSPTEGVWFASRPGRKMAVIAALAGIVFTPLLVVIHAVLIEPARLFSGVSAVVAGGLLPVAVIVVVLAVLYRVVKNRPAATRRDAVQTIFVLMVSVFLALTCIGVYFRGPGMKLYWPW